MGEMKEEKFPSKVKQGTFEDRKIPNTALHEFLFGSTIRDERISKPRTALS
jgi:hypothetical protein